mgnify:CR=1 FL=1
MSAAAARYTHADEYGAEWGYDGAHCARIRPIAFIASTERAFAAVCADSTLIGVWGDETYGGKVPGELLRITGITAVAANGYVFVIILGTVVSIMRCEAMQSAGKYLKYSTL